MQKYLWMQLFLLEHSDVPSPVFITLRMRGVVRVINTVHDKLANGILLDRWAYQTFQIQVLSRAVIDYRRLIIWTAIYVD